MADMPEKRVIKYTRIEWVIGDEYAEYGIARTLEDGILFAKREMLDTYGVSPTDDMFKWRAGDGGSIILWIDTKEE